MIVQRLPAVRRIDAFGIVEVQHRLFAGSERYTLMVRRQEPVAPRLRIQRLAARPQRHQHHERRHVFVLAPQPVTQPRPHRRPAADLRSCLHEDNCRLVIDRLGVHGFDEAQLVDDAGGIRKQVAHPCAAFAVLLERRERLYQGKCGLVGDHARISLRATDRIRYFSSMPRFQRRLVVEQFHLRRTAALEEVDDALRSRREVAAVEDTIRRIRRIQQMRHGHRAESDGGSFEEVAAGLVGHVIARSFRSL